MKHMRNPMGLAFVMLTVTLPLSVLFAWSGGVMVPAAVGMLAVSAFIDIASAKHSDDFDEYQLAKIRSFLNRSVLLAPFAAAAAGGLILHSGLSAPVVVHGALALMWLYYAVHILILMICYKMEGDEMKLKGKIGFWWLMTFALINIVLLYSISAATTMTWRGIVLAVLIVLDIFMAAWTFNNCVVLDDQYFTVHFGFSRNRVPYRDVTRISRTNSVAAGSALSFDRLLIESGGKKILIALRDKERFIAEVLKRNGEVIVKP